MGKFARLKNLARGKWAAKRSSTNTGLTESELEEELKTVRPPPATSSTVNTSAEEKPPVESQPQEDPAPDAAERDAEGNIIKTL